MAGCDSSRFLVTCRHFVRTVGKPELQPGASPSPYLCIVRISSVLVFHSPQPSRSTSAVSCVEWGEFCPFCSVFAECQCPNVLPEEQIPMSQLTSENGTVIVTAGRYFSPYLIAGEWAGKVWAELCLLCLAALHLLWVWVDPHLR